MTLVDNHAPATTDSTPPATGIAFTHDLAVIGMGYVGLPTALAFHRAGEKVLGIDVDTHRLAAITDQRVDLIPDDHLQLSAALTDDRFCLSDQPATISQAACVLICVPTPVDRHLTPDLRALEAACAMVVDRAVAGQLIILTSTSYVGTTRALLADPSLPAVWCPAAMWRLHPARNGSIRAM